MFYVWVVTDEQNITVFKDDKNIVIKNMELTYSTHKDGVPEIEANTQDYVK